METDFFRGSSLNKSEKGVQEPYPALFELLPSVKYEELPPLLIGETSDLTSAASLPKLTEVFYEAKDGIEQSESSPPETLRCASPCNFSSWSLPHKLGAKNFKFLI